MVTITRKDGSTVAYEANEVEVRDGVASICSVVVAGYSASVSRIVLAVVSMDAIERIDACEPQILPTRPTQ
nr:hypothetical protein [uncultured Rhodopila sp.]